MTVKLHDTLTRKQRELSPIDGKTFRFYCCGPTVYGPAHIGNFRTFVMHDVFRRVLETEGTPTLHVRNITDVDDKTIRDAQASGKSLKEFTSYWTEKFHADCEALGCLPPHIEPSAIEHIPQQIAMIEQLIEKGHAYPSGDGSVYFSVSSFPEYGQLSHLDTRELDLGKTQNQRADADEYEKDSVADFVLWKSRKPEDGDNYWSSPWGDGRPGWHLECSAMIKEYLGENFDLHSGGVDLVFPHHENEIAQSRCSCGGDFAAHWFHITHLMVDGGKMSKSLGNLYTIDDLAEKGHSAMEVRYVLISGHYRKQLNFTLDSLHAAQEALQKLAKGRAALASAGGDSSNIQADIRSSAFAPALEALNKDLNTPAALGHLFSGLKAAQKLSGEEAAANLAAFDSLLSALGLELPAIEEAANTDIPADIQDLAERRRQAKQNKDWAASDQLRDELAALGWTIKDNPDGYELTQ
ncbi:cysteine--tRNA ligase [Verrucomicrobiaceae bacterium N1E253]|uniref:Cysteine--tRNA ligase n=1 Tax=Oceaniferula marina TaxID=2748318 RepID=A0A851GJP0_9BACT|nr:cysteine--tRNA ligase [Oceaniferula marina]